MRTQPGMCESPSNYHTNSEKGRKHEEHKYYNNIEFKKFQI